MADGNCRICGGGLPAEPFTPDRRTQRCCSIECLREHWRRKNAAQYAKRSAPRSECGWCHQPKPLVVSRRYCSTECCDARKAHRDRWHGDTTVCPLVVRCCVECGATFVATSTQRRCPPHQANPRKSAAKRDGQHRYRARKRDTTAERFTSMEIFDRDGWCCQLCGEDIDRSLRHPDPMAPSLDHVVPLSKGGAHTRANVQASHLDCNVRKNNRTQLEVAG